MLRFVVLHHTHWPGHPDHYDLMLQIAEGSNDDDSVLKTFSTLVDDIPSNGAELRLIQNHRRAYLRLEGELTGNRGRVEQVDSGGLEWSTESEFRLFGKILCGNFRIESKNGVFKIVERR